MQLTIQYDPDESELYDVLDQVAKTFGTTMKDLVDTYTDAAQNNAGSTDEAGALQNLGPWNDRRARQILEQIADGARRAVALLVVAGKVPAPVVAEFLETNNLRGSFSSFRAAAKRVRGLPDGEKPFAKVYTPSSGFEYVMNLDRRELFEGALKAIGQEELLESATKFALENGLVA